MEVYSYSDDQLAEVLSNDYTPKSIIEKKNHFLYLKEYLSNPSISATTIVVEKEYVSRDYLHDYISYYSLCFEKYDKFCRRIHFFSDSFSEDEFKSALVDDTTEKSSDIWNSYLGFTVVKPIPITVIGITLLKTYSNDIAFGSRHFWGIRKYNVHLFGKTLELESLAFQEQDSVVAACATTAIWSMLNKASTDHHTVLKSPNEITKDADNLSSDGSRLFPNNGLNILQISQSIVNSGLVSEIKQPDYPIQNKDGVEIGRFVSNLYVKKVINAYSAIGIPILLVISVPNGNNYGLHAVAVSGYKKKAPTQITPKKEISYLAENIEKLYVHDDQWGPFVRVTFDNDIELKTPWSELNNPPGKPTYSTNVVVPLYPKIRISYEDIDAITLGLDLILTLFFDKAIKEDLVWDIKLKFSEKFKEEVKASEFMDDSEKINYLTQNSPKYIWVVSCYVGESKIFDFTFDATDMKNGMIGRHVICYLSNEIKQQFNQFLVLNEPMLSSMFERHLASSLYYKFLVDQTN
ncbi:MAG: hypothetical protein ACFHU9_12205 [Fluviicola sp.]